MNEDAGIGEVIDVRVGDAHGHRRVELLQRRAVSRLRSLPNSRICHGRRLIDDPASLDLDPRHVRDVRVVDQASLAGIGEVVGGQRVAANVDVPAIAGRGRGQALALVLRGRSHRVAIEDVVHLHAAGGDADRVVAERGQDHRHPLLTGRLVTGNAQDTDLGISTGIDERAGRRLDAVVDPRDEAGPALLRRSHPGRAISCRQ